MLLVVTFDTEPPTNLDNGLPLINSLISHLPIPETFPALVYSQISHGYVGLLPPYRGIHTKSHFTFTIPKGANI